MFICFVSLSPHMNEVIWYLSFSDDLFHLAQYTLVSSMLLQMARFHSFWLPSNCCIYIYHIFFIHLSVEDIWALSIHWLLSMVLLQTLRCMCPFKTVLLYPLDKYLIVQLLGRRVVLVLIFWGTFILFSRVAAPVCIPTSRAREFLFLHILTNIYCSLCCWF